jgi:hypothetical protein
MRARLRSRRQREECPHSNDQGNKHTPVLLEPLHDFILGDDDVTGLPHFRRVFGG